MIKQIALSTLALAAVPFVSPSVNAMTLSEAKWEICDAAKEYIQLGTIRQSTEEVILYSQWLASQNNLGTSGRLELQRHGQSCLMGFN